MISEVKNSERDLLFVLSLISGVALSLLLNTVVNMKDPAIMQAKQEFVTEPGGEDWVKAVLMFVAMLAGMFFNQLFESLKARKSAGHTTIDIVKIILKGWRGISFWMAVVVSPIIFYGTYYLVSTLPDGKVAYFYAFQNGFFWYNICLLYTSPSPRD